MLADPFFYAVAIPAVILVGLSKGGLGGATALLGVPMMSLAIPPVQAAAIMLPILIVMDIVSLWTWRAYMDGKTLVIMLPGAIAGITIGWLTAAYVNNEQIRLIVGLVAFLFVLRYIQETLQQRRRTRLAARHQSAADQAANGDMQLRQAGRAHRKFAGTFWGTIAGFTSFVSHAGGPPYQIYTLPLRQDPKIYIGTSVRFFAVINAIKLIPYFALGQFDTTNLGLSAILMPIAPVATLAGAWIVRRIQPAVFYPLMYLMVFIISLKLIADGLAGLGIG